MALLGPSGSGKTTLLRMIAGLEEVTGGQIFFDDEDFTHTRVQDRHVGMVFQSYALFKHMTVAENIEFAMRMRGLEGDRRKRVSELLDLIQLPHCATRLPSQLSGASLLERRLSDETQSVDQP